jgi:AcrR family transcriptional regulator
MTALVNFRRQSDSSMGLRSSQKAERRIALEEAALNLFAEQGFDATSIDQICDRARTSKTTFFRYFKSKADVIVVQQDAKMPVLRRAILERPDNENDLIAVLYAIHQVWAPAVDPVRTRKSLDALLGSDVLRGLNDDMNRTWLRQIAETLAERRGLDAVDEQCRVTARVANGTVASAVEAWQADNCREELGDIIERSLAKLLELCAVWAELDLPKEFGNRAASPHRD